MQDVCSPSSKTCLSNKMLFYHCILIKMLQNVFVYENRSNSLQWENGIS